mmetsp:Transcript_11773/g.1753  ORF Transcript_11773/g.1753 Transcript_11773/m.1753 type:complete len:88 (+) Transcript_11773:3-266(+)
MLEQVKYFRINDEPNAACASNRPETEYEEYLPKSQSMEDFRKREMLMERELNRKEKEKGDSIRQLLDNMTPRVVYNTLLSIRYPKNH